MPELPEVETIKRGLSDLLPGLTIRSVDFDWPKSFPNAAADVEEFLIGATVIQVRRRAKVLIIDLSSKYSLVIHLKMTGQLVYQQNAISNTKKGLRFGAGHPSNSLIGELPDKSTRVILYLLDKKSAALGSNARKNREAERNVDDLRRVSTGNSDAAVAEERWQSFGLCPKPDQRVAALFFNDQRKFGWVRLLPTLEVPNIDFMRKVGPEPLEDDFKSSDFIRRFRKYPNRKIKASLLDQTVIAGVGNIYADESLWGAKIYPEQVVSSLSDSKLRNLYTELRYVLNLSIAKGGSTDRNYVDAKGRRGSYLEFARVFRREGQACPRCGTEIIKIRVAGRGTHLCPKCQTLKI